MKYTTRVVLKGLGKQIENAWKWQEVQKRTDANIPINKINPSAQKNLLALDTFVPTYMEETETNPQISAVIKNSSRESKSSWKKEERNKMNPVTKNLLQNLNCENRFLSFRYIWHQMKMQLRKILILSAVDDQTIAAFGKMKFIHQTLHGGIEVGEKSRVGWIQLYQRLNRLLRDD